MTEPQHTAAARLAALHWRWKAFDELTSAEVYAMLAARSAVFVIEQNSPVWRYRRTRSRRVAPARVRPGCGCVRASAHGCRAAAARRLSARASTRRRRRRYSHRRPCADDRGISRHRSGQRDAGSRDRAYSQAVARHAFACMRRPICKVSMARLVLSRCPRFTRKTAFRTCGCVRRDGDSAAMSARPSGVDK